VHLNILSALIVHFLTNTTPKPSTFNVFVSFPQRSEFNPNRHSLFFVNRYYSSLSSNKSTFPSWRSNGLILY